MSKSKAKQIILTRGAAIMDESNVGMQLLKKMGWAEDTGLGKDGRGILEPVKASSNFGRKGLGKCPSSASIDMIQQVQFESILQNLHSVAGNVSSSSEDDEEDGRVSKTQKPRLCYGRFLRDKDISKCDERMLKVVLGKSVEQSKNSSPVKSCPPSPTNETAENITYDHKKFGVKTYSSSTDLKSYFAEKMKALGSRKNGITTEPPKKRFRCENGSPNSSPLGFEREEHPSPTQASSGTVDTSSHLNPSDAGSLNSTSKKMEKKSGKSGFTI